MTKKTYEVKVGSMSYGHYDDKTDAKRVAKAVRKLYAHKKIAVKAAKMGA